MKALAVIATFTASIILVANGYLLPDAVQYPDCGSDGYFTYAVNNILEPPYMNESINLCITPGTKLIDYMQRAVLNNPTNFNNFTATFTSPYGFYVDSVNGLFDRSYIDGVFWVILNSTDLPVEQAVSSYEPIANEVITFNFTNFWPGSTA